MLVVGATRVEVDDRSPAGVRSIGVGGDNLTDEDFLVSGFNQPGIGYTIATIGPPREWWARVKYRF